MNQLQEALSAAYDEVSSDNADVSADERSEEVVEGHDGGAGDDSHGVESGGFGRTDDVESVPEREDAVLEPVQGEEDTSDLSDSLSTPPRGLSPQAREEWANTPESVRAEIAKREADYERGITQYAANAKRAEAMDKALAPYQQLFAMNGGAGNVMPGLLQTAAQLQMGTAQQKAQTVAALIQQFGVDIKTLDNLLVGESPPPEAQLDQLLNQKLQPLQKQLETYQQREQQYASQQQRQVTSELDAFAKQNEFYEDVKMDMADLLDMASTRGYNMSLSEAYEKACLMRPDIMKIRKARESAATDQRKSAASSIRGKPVGNESAASLSMRDTIAAAFENSGRI